MKNMLDKLANSDESKGDMHTQAKLQVLKELRDMAMGMMGDKMRDKMPHEMHGVEVMAPDQEGLEKGLDLAKEVLPQEGAHEEAMEEKVHPGIHEEVSEMDEADDMSDDELDAMIAELQAKKAARGSSY